MHGRSFALTACALGLGFASGACASTHHADPDDFDAVNVDAAQSFDAASLAPADAQPGTDAAPPADAQPDAIDAQPVIVGAALFGDASGMYTCEQGLVGSSFALDTSDCAQRPASACEGEQDGDPRPGRHVARQLSKLCGAGSLPVGLTLDEQGCPNAVYAFSVSIGDPLVSCLRTQLQTRRYPCPFRCSTYADL
jgi:hypothetical protein